MKIIKGRSIYSVTEVNNLARQTLEDMSFWVEGEVSSLKGLNTHYRYLYFDLKDSQTNYKLPCILEPDIYSRLSFEMQDGKKIIALGNLSLWEKDGRYQMYIHAIEEFGEGILLVQLEMLKKKLEEKGYFDSAKKKFLPSFPINIAVISSSVSDAWYDFKKHSIDIIPAINITLFDVNVQGENAPIQIINALKHADQNNFDAIILVRGGGSIEDLSAFNNEDVAKAIFKAKTPIVVGVGHEKDVTIAQLVADVAASTPTDAAKIITANFIILKTKLDSYLEIFKKSLTTYFSLNFQNLDLLLTKLSLRGQSYQEIFQKLNTLITQLKSNWKFYFNKAQARLNLTTGKLYLLSPQSTLARGYSITQDMQNHILKDVKNVAIGSRIKVRLAKGLIFSKVLEKQIKLLYNGQGS